MCSLQNVSICGILKISHRTVYPSFSNLAIADEVIAATFIAVHLMSLLLLLSMLWN